MRIALRVVLLLAILVVLLFADQAFETSRLASVHASRVADLRERGLLGPTNPAAEVPSPAAALWVERLRLLSEAAEVLPFRTIDIRGEWAALPAPQVESALKLARELEVHLEQVPAGVARVARDEEWSQVVFRGAPPRASIVVRRVVARAGTTIFLSYPGRFQVLGNLMAFAAERCLGEPAGTTTSARRMGAALELLGELDDASFSAGELRLQLQRTWLAHLAELRQCHGLDPVIFFEILDPLLARVATLDRARHSLMQLVESSLGPEYSAWPREPPALAIFERGGHLADARKLLDELEVQLELLNTRAQLAAPRIPKWRRIVGGLDLGRRSDTDLSAARELALTRVVLALDAHRRETGSWPTGLTELERWFPAGAPTDPRTDAPFDYVLAGTTATVQVASLALSAPSSPATAGVPRLRWDLEGEE